MSETITNGQLLYQRALALRVTHGYGWESLPPADRARWETLAEQSAFLESEAIARLSAVERLVHESLRRQVRQSAALASLQIQVEAMSEQLAALRAHIESLSLSVPVVLADYERLKAESAASAEDRAALVEIASKVEAIKKQVDTVVTVEPQPQ